jgi:hypothetical protein
MGREPEQNTHPDDAPSPAEGALSPASWAALVLARVNRSDTGTLRASSDGVERTFRFIRGTPVNATSTDPIEDFTETLVRAGGLEASRLNWIRKHTGADESEVEALVGAGTITRNAVNAHHAVHIQHLIAATLAWSAGEFSWVPTPSIDERFEQNLLPSVSAISGLMNGVMGGFDLGALHTYVDAADAGDYLPDPRMTGGTPPTWIPADLKGIHSVLGQGQSRFESAATLGCDPDRLAALLWLLTTTGWAHRAKPPAALVPLGSVSTIQTGEPVPAAVPAPTPIAAETPPAAQPTPAPAPVAKAPVAPRPAPQAPAAPVVAPKPPRARTPEPPKAPRPAAPAAPPKARKSGGLPEAQTFIKNGDFDGAYSLLTKVRRDLPSCPHTLAALGWSAWRTGNLGTNAYDGPEDYLLLALTFDAQHPQALEYYARIAMEKGEKENARNRLLQLLKAAPDSEWAQESLDELTPKNGNKGGLRLWPKGRS